MDTLQPGPHTVSLYVSDPLVQRVVREQAQARHLPVRFVAAGEPAAIVVALPVRLGALLQRIRQISLRLSATAQLARIGAFVFDPALGVLISAADEEIALTEKEAAILKCLLQAQGAFVSRRDLLTQVWGYAEGVETHTLETHVYRLRQKLEHDPARPVTLITAEQGYRLNI